MAGLPRRMVGNRSSEMAFVPQMATPLAQQIHSKQSTSRQRRASPNGCSTCRRQTAKARNLLRSAAVAAAAVALVSSSPGEGHAVGLEKGRLEKCRGDVPCISTTSVGNPSKFGPPWSYQPQTDDADVAWASLKKAVEENKDHGVIVDSVDGPKTYYMHAEFPSSVRGTDDIEFRLVKSDSLVTYRSASREAIYIYPIQTPINLEKNKTRLEDIRRDLGWEEFSGIQE